MAKTFKYWVIVAGNTPTAFRSREQEPLLPTLKQLQRTQPNVTLGWFERDRLWTSPEQAEQDFERRRGLYRERGAAWRPGGQHKDPKARVELTRDQKRAKFKKQLIFKSKEASSGDVQDKSSSAGDSDSGERPITSKTAKPAWVRKPAGSARPPFKPAGPGATRSFGPRRSAPTGSVAPRRRDSGSFGRKRGPK